MIAALEFASAYDLTLLVLGVAVLAIATLLRALAGRVLAFPLVLVALGLLAWNLPLGLPSPDPRVHGGLTLRLTELGVIVSLMGVGLKIDRLPSPSTWGSTWRLLAVTMPLSIAAVAVLGWWAVGLAPAAALLLGAVLAPTDPVLAADVQVGEPLEALVEEHAGGTAQADDEAEDELRFALTSEAGLNDALAFPFTYLALLVAAKGVEPAAWWTQWLLQDVLYRIGVGAAVGVVGGRLLARALLSLPRETERDRATTGTGALAGTLLLYGATEAVSGYGFLAVFVGALVLRHRESNAEAHVSLHVFAEQAEQLLMALILVAFGGAVATGLLAPLTGPAAIVVIAFVLLVRPAAGALALVGSSRLSGRDRFVASFFGVRGVGSFFYLAYALNEMAFEEGDLLWAITAAVVLLSVVVHGLAAAPAMRWRERAGRPTYPVPGADVADVR